MNFRELFDVQGIYLNHASVSPLPWETIEAMDKYLDERRRYGSRKEMEWFERTEEIRNAVARFIGASTEEIAFTKSTTHGLMLVAQGIPWNEGDEILIVNGEFPANIYPWLSLDERGVVVKFLEPVMGRVELEQVKKNVTEKTRLFALSFVDYLTGHRRDLKTIGGFLREKGILFSVDAIQGLGVFPLDLSATPIDFLSSGGTKWLFSPMGTGIFYVRKGLLNTLKIPFIGWRGVKNFLDFSEYDMTPRPDARRFEMDTYNLAGVMGFGASINLISEIGVSFIMEKVIALTDYLYERLKDIRGIKILTPRDYEKEKSGIITFRIEGIPAPDVKEYLEKMEIEVSERGGWIRVSPHFYNKKEEIEELIKEIVRINS